MKNRLFVLGIILIVSFPAPAQSDSSRSKPSWFFSIHSGALLGRGLNTTSATAMAIQGIRYNRWSLGVGLGYDKYIAWRTMPLFTALGYDLGSRMKDRTFFIQITTGFSPAWYSPPEELPLIYESDGGYFFHPVLGYRFETSKVSLYFSAGYKLQKIIYDQIPGWSNWIGSGQISIEHDIQRVSVQLGLGVH